MFALSPIRKKHPVRAAAVFGGIGALFMFLVNAVAKDGIDVVSGKVAVKVLASALLWAGLARARLWHERSRSAPRES